MYHWRIEQLILPVILATLLLLSVMQTGHGLHP